MGARRIFFLIQMNDRIIAHIDMNSYFASVEQQARPALRGRPMAVVGPSKRSIIIAASIEAKKLGIKTGTQIKDALAICPRLPLIKADCQKYEALSREFIEIFISKTPQVEIFSIDEAFLDLSDCVSNLEEAESLVGKIKQEISQRLGKYIQCSCGIATNKFIAKLASEAKKPDGLTIVKTGEEIQFLDQFELDEACGIGNRIKERLNRMGVESFKDLRRVNQTTLTLIFNSYGLKLFNIARGIDREPVKPYYLVTKPKSISRSKTLSFNTFDKNLIDKVALFFCQDIACELKNKGLVCGQIGIYLRFQDFSGFAKTQRIKAPTDLATNLHFFAKKTLGNLVLKNSVRKIGVWCSSLKENNGQLSLCPKFETKRKIEIISEQINSKYGKKTTCFASTVGLNFSPSPSYGFKKDLLS